MIEPICLTAGTHLFDVLIWYDRGRSSQRKATSVDRMAEHTVSPRVMLPFYGHAMA